MSDHYRTFTFLFRWAFQSLIFAVVMAWAGTASGETLKFQAKLINYLLNKDVSGFLANLPTSSPQPTDLGEGYTALTIAAIVDDEIMTRALIESGYTPQNDPDAVYWAVSLGSLNTLKEFFRRDSSLKPQADKLLARVFSPVNRSAILQLLTILVNKEINTPGYLNSNLSCAFDEEQEFSYRKLYLLTEEQIRVVEFLAEEGAQLNFLDSSSGSEKIPLTKAALDAGEIELYYKILSLRGEINQFDAFSAIEAAVAANNASGVRFVLSKFPNVLPVDKRKILLNKIGDKVSPELFMELTEGLDTLSDSNLSNYLLSKFVSMDDDAAVAQAILLGADAKGGAPVPLAVALRNGSVRTLPILLNAGADPKAIDKFGKSIAHGLYAFLQETGFGSNKCTTTQRVKRISAILTTLIQVGLPIDQRDREGKTPLDEFSGASFFPETILLPLSTNSETVKSAVFAAVDESNFEFFHWLIQKRNALASSRDSKNRSLLEHALDARNIQSIELLFELIAKPELEFPQSSLPTVVAKLDRLECKTCRDRLIPFLSSPDDLTEDGDPLLKVAIEKMDRDLARILLAAGARPDVPGKFGTRAVDYLCGVRPTKIQSIALASFRFELLALFRDAGVNLASITYPEGGLLVKCFKSIPFDQQFFDTLFEITGRKIEPTVIFSTIRNGGRPILEWLFAKGADFAIKDTNGQTTLRVAVEYKNVDAVNFLLAKQPELLNIPTADGVTPVELAFAMNQPLLARILQAAGSNINIRSLQEISNSGFQSALKNDDLAEIFLLRVLDTQLLKTMSTPSYEDVLKKFSLSNAARISVPRWNFTATPPWRSFGEHDTGSRKIIFPDLPPQYEDFGIFMLSSISADGHDLVSLVRSLSDNSYGFCMLPNECYNGICGFCSAYEFIASTSFSIPRCEFDEQINPTCLPGVKIENDVMNEATINISQGDKAETLEAGATRLLDRSEGEIKVAVGPVRGATFYSRFSVRMDVPPWMDTDLGVKSSQRLRHYMSLRDWADQLSGKVPAKMISAKSTLAAYIYVSTVIAKSHYKDLAESDLRRSATLIASLPPIFDELLGVFQGIDQITYESLPVLIEKIKQMGEAIGLDPTRSAELRKLASELQQANELSLETRAKLVSLRDALLAHHTAIGDTMRIALLEYLQYVDPEKSSIIQSLTSNVKAAVVRRLTRQKGEVTGVVQRNLDIKLSSYFQ